MSKQTPPKILVVDDDEIILIALEETLALENYDVVTTPSAKQALELISQEEFAAIISDQRMAEMTGLELLHQIKTIAPDTSRILITGVLTLKTVIDAINKGEIYRFISKPWLREELLATINNAVQRYELIRMNRSLQKNTLQLNEQLAESNAELQKKVQQLTEQKEQLDRANEALQKNFEHSLQLVYRITDTYHPLMGKETKAVVELCERIAQAGELKEQDRRTLITAAWLHKIGLIGISRELFNKARKTPELLSEEERPLFRNHPIFGQMLAGFVDSKDIGMAIRCAYEFWDGSGYPDGLAGENIPRMARLLSIAIYFVESQLSREDTIDRILKESGYKFEPAAVDLFIRGTRIVTLPQKVREITAEELKPGHVLARGIYSPTGLLLVGEGERLSQSMVDKIKLHHSRSISSQHLLIYH